MQSSCLSPIFVVGAPRSGTTMLAAMLGSHPELAAGPETQFFSKLAPEALKRATTDEQWPRMATQMIGSLTLAEQPVIDLFETSPAGVTAFLSERGPSVQTMLEALTVPYAEARGAQRWVEKTPNHILNLPTLRSLWPDAVIVRIIRDPRDVGLSTRKLPTFSNEILPNVYLWQQWNAQAENFLARDPLALSLRYEDLVDDPEGQLRQLCDLAQLAFDPAMITFSDAAADVSSANETWKNQVASGLTASRQYAWKNDLPAEWRTVCDLVCHELLVTHGYEAGPEPSETRTAFRMSRSYIEAQQNVLRVQAEDGIRWMPCDNHTAADRIVDHPQYSRFRNPAALIRLGLGQRRARRERALIA